MLSDLYMVGSFVLGLKHIQCTVNRVNNLLIYVREATTDQLSNIFMIRAKGDSLSKSALEVYIFVLFVMM